MEVMIAASVYPFLSFFSFRQAKVALAEGRRIHVRILRGGESLDEVDGVLYSCLG